LQVIITHCERFGLVTNKRADFELFKETFNLTLKKEHLTLEGLHKIVAIRAFLNRGLSPELKAAFPEITPTGRPLVTTNLKIQDLS
jgi:hypothetical protein